MMGWSLRTTVVGLLMVTLTPLAHAAEPGTRVVDAAWAKAMKANDLEGVLNCYAPDATLWLPGVPVAKGMARPWVVWKRRSGRSTCS